MLLRKHISMYNVYNILGARFLLLDIHINRKFVGEIAFILQKSLCALHIVFSHYHLCKHMVPTIIVYYTYILYHIQT